MVGVTVGNIVCIKYPNGWEFNGLDHGNYSAYFWLFTLRMLDIFLGMSGSNVGRGSRAPGSSWIYKY